MSGTATRRGLFGRALSGGAMTAGSYAVTQGLRLVSNLILTRLLFPEAFGIMSLVTVVLVGLQMFSDAGVGQAIARSPRGDEQRFLDTAWTVNVARGGLLWLLTWALAWPVSRFYEAPELALLLPAAGVSLLIAGFNPTRIDTANRHLLLGRVTLLDLVAQALGIAATVALAFTLRSVWALVLGAVLTAVIKLVLMSLLLPGSRNRFHWEPEAARELISFGKWILLSTVCGFLMGQGDKAILGAYLSMTELGVYNIGYFLASFPMLMSIAVVARIMVPLYRDHPPHASEINAARMRKLRFGITLSGMALVFAVALAGEWLVSVMYDARYALAGAVVVGVAMVQLLMAVGTTYDQAALAAGDGRGYFLALAGRATLQTLSFLIGAHFGGIGGALLGQGIGMALAHPVIVWLAIRHRVWDPLHDAVTIGVAGAMLLSIWALHGHSLMALFL